MNKYTLQVKFLMTKAGRFLRNFTWEGGIQGVFLQKQWEKGKLFLRCDMISL